MKFLLTMSWHKTPTLIGSLPPSGGIYFFRAKQCRVLMTCGCSCRQEGTWINFTGDQLGILFASAVFDAYKASGKPLSMYFGV